MTATQNVSCTCADEDQEESSHYTHFKVPAVAGCAHTAHLILQICFQLLNRPELSGLQIENFNKCLKSELKLRAFFLWARDCGTAFLKT